MTRYVIVSPDGIVVNAIEWDGQTGWAPPEDYSAFPDPEGTAEIGGTWPPPPPDEAPVSEIPDGS